jgi:hypothetical protein
VFPTLGSAHPKGYIDTGNELTVIDPHAYISVEAVEQCAQFIGYPTKDEHADALARIERLEQELESTKNALAEADRLVEAIDVIESRDFRARKKPGRPRKNDELAEA